MEEKALKRNRLKINLLIFLIVILFFLSTVLSEQADEPRSSDWYYQESEQALNNENYTYALELLEKAKSLYPGTVRFNIMLADLYYKKELYPNALTEYLEAESKTPADTYILSQIAFCYGLLNQEEMALAYYKKLLQYKPDDVITIDWMGWVYQKVYQLKKAEELLLRAIEEFGLQARLAGTLASVYADLFEYKKAKYYYEKAIELSLKDSNSNAAAIYYYNLSILEERFYNYDQAFAATENAISLQEWASGRRMKGSLLHMQMDYRASKQEYENALIYDDTPYAAINLAELDKDFGYLTRARQSILNIISQKDLDWMIYYSTNVNEYYERLYKLISDIFQGLANIELHTPREGLWEELAGLGQAFIYRIQSWYYEQKYKLAAIATARAYLEADNRLKGYLELMEVNADYKEIALKYCLWAKNTETALIPKARNYYNLLEGVISASPDLLKESLNLLDSRWQKGQISLALQTLIPILGEKGEKLERRRAINRLYTINPGGLIQYGFGLPLELHVEIEDPGIRQEAGKYFLNMLKKAGSEISDQNDNRDFQYELYLHWYVKQRFEFQLINKSNHKLVRQGVLQVEDGSLSSQCASLVRRMLFEHIYVAD
jgi:tetratricopeptide (TPR) repeat protein